MNHPVITIAKYTLIEAIKNRLFALTVIGLVCIFGLTQFIGELVITETQQVQGALIGLTMRLFAVFIVSLFVITSVVREFNDKTLEAIISLPIPRYFYYSGKLLGFCFLSVITAVIISLPLFIYADYMQVLLWNASLVCELFIVTGLCLLCLFTMGHITTAFSAVMAFYILSRCIGTIQLISQSPILEANTPSQEIINLLINMIAFILPELDHFTQTDWIVYNTGSLNDMLIIVTQTAIYMALLAGTALFDLYRKNF